jgi:hypothetical protein
MQEQFLMAIPAPALDLQTWIMLAEGLLLVEVRENLKQVRNGNYEPLKELWKA